MSDAECFEWYKNMYLKMGYAKDEAKRRAKIDLDYQISLFKMCETFGVDMAVDYEYSK